MSRVNGNLVRQGAQVSQVLEAVSEELRQLVMTSLRVQTQVSLLLSNSPDAQSETVYNIQDLDRITQTVGALADFLDVLAPQIQPDWRVNTVAATKLLSMMDLASRLAIPDKDNQDGAQIDGSAGDCHYL